MPEEPVPLLLAVKILLIALPVPDPAPTALNSTPTSFPSVTEAPTVAQFVSPAELII